MKYLVALLLYLTGTVVYAADAEVTLRHLVGSIYLVEDSYFAKTNSLVYIGPRTVTVIGATHTPDTARLLVQEIRKVTDKPIGTVVNNDYNPEYAGGNGYWKEIGANIVSTELTSRLLAREWDLVCDFTRKYFPDYPHVSLVLPTLTYPGDFELQDGNVQALYLGPSHTPDDIFIYFPREKLLYAGSILKEHLGNLAFADIGEYQRTLTKFKQLHLDIQTVISGHWSPVHGRELIDHYLQMLREYDRKRGGDK